MALIKLLSQIKNLIPTACDDGTMNSSNEIFVEGNKPLYAFVFQKKNKRFIRLFQVQFVTYKKDDEAFLIISDIDRAINSATLSVNVKYKKLTSSLDNGWGFKINTSGLYIETTHPDDYEVYFATSYKDLGDIRETKIKTDVMVAEKIYV